MFLTERARAILFTAAVVVTATSLILAAQAFQPRPPTLLRGITLSLVIEGPGWTITHQNNDTVNNTVFLFLLEAARTRHFTLEWENYSPPLSAVFIIAINGARNGDAHQYWQFWVNSVYGPTAADLAVLRGGETVLWKFDVSEEG